MVSARPVARQVFLLQAAGPCRRRTCPSSRAGRSRIPRTPADSWTSGSTRCSRSRCAPARHHGHGHLLARRQARALRTGRRLPRRGAGGPRRAAVSIDNARRYTREHTPVGHAPAQPAASGAAGPERPRRRLQLSARARGAGRGRRGLVRRHPAAGRARGAGRRGHRGTRTARGGHDGTAPYSGPQLLRPGPRARRTRSPTAAAPPRTCAARPRRTRAAGGLFWWPSSPSGGVRGTRRTAR